MSKETAYAFQVNLKGMIALLSEHLYSDPNTFIRELLQNAVDAITAIRYLDEEHAGEIKVTLPNEADDSFVFQDNGIGLKEEEIHRFLSVIGESSKGKDLNEAKDFIGKFGIGLLSCFVVSDEIVVETCSALEKIAWRWTAQAEGDYKIERMDEDIPFGTRVILKPKAQFKHIFKYAYFKGKLKHYGDALREKVVLQKGEMQDVLNTQQPAWLNSSDRGTLLEVGKDTFNVNFLDAVPFHTAHGDCTGVLYILPFKTQFSSKQHHRVYLKRMFLSEEDQSLLPNWAFFVRMLVNTEGLSATASRESLMKNELLQKTRKEIAVALKDYLKNCKDIDPSVYRRIIQTHFLHLKAFALEDNDFLDIFLDDIPFETNRGQRNFREIRQFQQTVYYSADFEDFKQIDRMADTQGILLINGSYTFDTELLKKIATRYPDLSIKAMLPSELVGTFVDLDAEQLKRLSTFKDLVQQILDEHGCALEIKHFRPHDTPAIYTKTEQSNVEQTVNQLKADANPFARVLKSAAKPRQRPILCLNADNELVQQIASVTDRYLLQSIVEVLYVQAMILGKYNVQEKEMKILNNALKNLIVMGLTNFVNI